MKAWDKLGTVGKAAAAVTSIIVLTAMIVSGAWASYTHFETRKAATIAHNELMVANTVLEQKLATRQLNAARERVLDLEIGKIRINNRTGLSTTEKEEQKAIFDQKIRILRKDIDCFEKGKLECTPDA